MRADGWDRDRVRNLPYDDLRYWYIQRVSYEQLLDEVDFQPGERLLDVGANTCWASNRFARLGLDVVALDIATAELQGLETAEYFLETGEVYFERVLSSMAAPALTSSSFDYVFCCEVLHHNDPQALRQTLSELHRVLKPGGKLLVINEPMRFPLRLKRDHGEEVAQFDGNEHVYFFHQYYAAARRAGFAVSLRRPKYNAFFSDQPTVLELEHGARRITWELGNYLLRRIPATRNAVYAYRTLIAGDLSLTMICTKAAAA
jgi:SAM-dependent methyltransferase